MKSIMNFLLVVVLFVGAAQIASAQSARPSSDVSTGIATLFARDPLTQSLCFRDGGGGHVFRDGLTRNQCSDLNFNSYNANSFSVGVEGDRRGVIIDLGTPDDLTAKYGFRETVSKGQGFASIDVKNGRALILKEYKTGELQPLAESAQLFTGSLKSVASAQVKLGHIYLMRITDSNGAADETFAKVLVIAHVPNESVTVRWQLITDNGTAKR